MSAFSFDTSALQDWLKDPSHLSQLAFATSSAAVIGCKQIKNYVKSISATNDPAVWNRRSLLHEKYSPSKVPSDIDVIIIGSGMGGLSCATILSRLGKKVLVLDQHDDTCGGGTHMFDVKGHTFDSGLHCTVPWSIPIFALTCLKRPSDVTPFDIIGEEDQTMDKIYLSNDAMPMDEFRMQYKELHMKKIYEMYPEEKAGLDEYIKLSDRSMLYVKFLLFSRLVPKCLQDLYWWFVPQSLKDTAGRTAKEILPKIIKNDRLISLLSSMWIDTGARPDCASFMMTASVFRGLAMEGGCYPRGGSTNMAKELVTVIEKNGGVVFAKADVKEISFDQKTGSVNGVMMRDGTFIPSKKVVSSTGYLNTMSYLVPEPITTRFSVPRSLSVAQSAGFVMINIGIDLPASVLGASSANVWHIPVDTNNDSFGPLERYFKDPLREGVDVPAFITFPSLKDIEHHKKFPNKTSCQMLMMANYEWFADFKAADSKGRPIRSSERKEGYERLKNMWKDKCMKIFLKYFPKAEGHFESIDISTPLTIENYLNTPFGGAVGIDVTPARFVDPDVRRALDVVTNIPGLYLTGQDTVLCGVTLAQLSGVITAFRMEGFCAAVKILLQSIILGDN